MDYKVKLNRKEIGLRIYKLIESSHKTREALAQFLELESPRVIYDWCSGKKLPGTENLYNLAKFFNVHIEDILS